MKVKQTNCFFVSGGGCGNLNGERSQTYKEDKERQERGEVFSYLLMVDFELKQIESDEVTENLQGKPKNKTIRMISTI